MSEPTMMPDTTNIGESIQYTSYRSDRTFSILDNVRWVFKHGGQASFEYKGRLYRTGDRTEGRENLYVEPMLEYLMPHGPSNTPALVAKFNPEKFEEFLDTFTIEDKTVRWILEHQRVWKYKFSAYQLEKYNYGSWFWFVYRKLPGVIYLRENGSYGGNERLCRWYLTLYPSVQIDVNKYSFDWPEAATFDGKQHWQEAVYEKCIHPKEEMAIPSIQIGPLKNITEILDTVWLNNKSLRTLFDTEYDSGTNLVGEYTDGY